MELKVGELYTSNRLGLFIITNLHEMCEDTNGFNYELIGTCERLSFGDRVYKLYHDERIKEATDLDIEEYLLNKMTRFDLCEKNSIFVDNNGIFVFGDGEDEAVYLNKEATLKLKEILNREII